MFTTVPEFTPYEAKYMAVMEKLKNTFLKKNHDYGSSVKKNYDKFETTKEYQWAKDNIHKYGFVIHYTSANEWITGYMDEAWHFRYIGVKEATEIYKSGMSVEEYIIRYHDK